MIPFFSFSNEEARLGRSADSTLLSAGLNDAYPITLDSPYQWLYGHYSFKLMNTLFFVGNMPTFKRNEKNGHGERTYMYRFFLFYKKNLDGYVQRLHVCEM